MAIIIDGTNAAGNIDLGTNGTITDLAVGGVPDGTIDTDAIAANAINGSKIAMGSDASGDILYNNGTDYVRLAKGTDGQVLTLASGVPSWAAAGGGAFSKVYKSNSSTSTAMNSGNDPVRVGGTGLEVTLTPPATTTSYLMMFHTGMHIGDDDGQWGIQFRVSDNDWDGNSTINFMHSQYGCEDNEKWRGQRTYMNEWKPGSTDEWKIGVWAQVWSSDGIDVTFNSHSGKSQLTVFELVDSAKSGDWG